MPYYKYMTVFNGVMGLSVLFVIWGQTYFFSWYGVYDNPQDIIKMRSEFRFTLIPGVFLLVPLMFFIMGFVSTFSLLHNKKQGEGVTIKESIFFILKRIAKLWPF